MSSGNRLDLSDYRMENAREILNVARLYVDSIDEHISISDNVTKKTDLDQFVMPSTERVRNADKYIREMRDNDADKNMNDDIQERKVKTAPVDWDSFSIPSERGRNVVAYMREMRENDR